MIRKGNKENVSLFKSSSQIFMGVPISEGISFCFFSGTSCAEVGNIFFQFQLRITIVGTIQKIIDQVDWFLFTNIFFSFAHSLPLRPYLFTFISYCYSHPPAKNSLYLENNAASTTRSGWCIQPSWSQELLRPQFSLFLLLTLPFLPFSTV